MRIVDKLSCGLLLDDSRDPCQFYRASIPNLRPEAETLASAIHRRAASGHSATPLFGGVQAAAEDPQGGEGIPANHCPKAAMTAAGDAICARTAAKAR